MIYLYVDKYPGCQMKVLIADDHEYFRNGLKSDLLNIIPDAVFASAGRADEVIAILEQDRAIDMVILDLYMPGSNQYDLVARVCNDRPELTVVIMSASEKCEDMRAVFDRGASGYIPKTAGSDIVLQAIQLILAGGVYFPSEVLLKSSAHNSDTISVSGIEKKVSLLTRRQHEVLKLLLEGMANKKIANQLNLSESTVKIHVTAILRTLEVKSRAEVIAAVRNLDRGQN